MRLWRAHAKKTIRKPRKPWKGTERIVICHRVICRNCRNCCNNCKALQAAHHPPLATQRHLLNSCEGAWPKMLRALQGLHRKCMQMLGLCAPMPTPPAMREINSETLWTWARTGACVLLEIESACTLGALLCNRFPFGWSTIQRRVQWGVWQEDGWGWWMTMGLN